MNAIMVMYEHAATFILKAEKIMDNKSFLVVCVNGYKEIGCG